TAATGGSVSACRTKMIVVVACDSKNHAKAIAVKTNVRIGNGRRRRRPRADAGRCDFGSSAIPRLPFGLRRTAGRTFRHDRIFRLDQSASRRHAHRFRMPPCDLSLEPPEAHRERGSGNDREREHDRQDHGPHHDGADQHDAEREERQHLDGRISRYAKGIQAIAKVHTAILTHSRAERPCPSSGRNTPSNQTTHPCATRSNCSIRWRTRPSASGVHVARNATTCSGSTYSSVPSMRISPASVSPPASSTTVPPEPVQTWRHCPLLGTKKLKLVPVDPLIRSHCSRIEQSPSRFVIVS